ncbi:FtsX-like permease family protein [Runella sp. CRIBMP]|uniref:ABC transporter permease n=1 Tax=Runella sp. CRIBMP TaxID=2683261 RepID=UPI001411CE14|nr:ABC transporter permease [Runella sp. CRIBMP]NBB19926.1 FtsX-like permease family protein [Runella sp. CRIBMP]
MLRNYLKIAIRNLVKNKVYSFINIVGLSAGMAVAILIGLWMWDELSYNKYHQNYEKIVRVMQHVTNNGEVQTWPNTPLPLAEELRKSYGSDFKHVTVAKDAYSILSYGEKKFSKKGAYFEPQVTEMLTLKMLKGTRNGLKNPNAILLSESVAKAFFGEADPLDKIMKMDNQTDVKVTGVYEDLPHNSEFHDITFIAPWQLYYNNNEWVRTMADPWRPNAFHIYAQLIPNADITTVSHKIKDAKLNKVSKELAKKKPEVFLHPMSKWHLYSDFKNGINVGGKIQYVWLFGISGLFVLLLACINFMNLSTARSEKRAKEVGIRKAVGSVRAQIVYQFFFESLLMVFFSFGFALLFAQLMLPFFNNVADKTMALPWNNLSFWMVGLGFSLLCGLVSGSYPAFYLSSFQPLKILKGTFRAGRWAALPRQVLVTIQFTVSVTLIIGTIIVFRQVKFAQNRPMGYNSNGLVTLPMYTSEIHTHFDAVKKELTKSGAIIDMAEAGSPPTENYSSTSTIEWKDKDPNLSVDFQTIAISFDYGKTIGWSFKEGRDFSKEFSTDSSGLILNEAAVKFMGLKNPVGETIKWYGTPNKVIGVVKDMIVQSPFQQVKPSIYHLTTEPGGVMIAKINPLTNAGKALSEVETVFKKFNPSQPFEYQFVDEEYAKKFDNEERIGQLVTFFAILAIFISCLGIFGLASFIAEQRTKEIGIRKVLGASVTNLWQMLSKDFVILVIISCVISAPIAYYFLQEWLQKYTYRTEISGWIFAVAGFGALVITLLTVSFQAIKAALMNPVKSLKTE